jgi:LCP family protein required for cell wall assembly
MKTKKILMITGIVVAVLLLLLLIAGLASFFYMDGMLDKMNYDTAYTTVTPEVATSIDQEEWVPIPTDDTTPTVDIGDITFPDDLPDGDEQGDHIVNIMIVGQDARPGEPPQRSDSMILMTFNKASGEITLTSFLRDQYVQIPGFGKTKLCHAYSYGGMPLLNQTLYNHYGIEVDGNVTLSFEGFAEIIDLLGGVDIELTQEEATALNQLESKQNWGLKAGMQRLTGKQALRYSRLRHIDSDLQRTERQRKVIMSVIAAYKNCTLTEMTYILEKTMPMITTNIPKERIYRYAFSLFPMFATSKINSQRLPANGTFQSGLIRVSEGYMASCQYNIDFEANRKYLEKIFDED